MSVNSVKTPKSDRISNWLRGLANSPLALLAQLANTRTSSEQSPKSSRETYRTAPSHATGSGRERPRSMSSEWVTESGTSGVTGIEDPFQGFSGGGSRPSTAVTNSSLQITPAKYEGNKPHDYGSPPASLSPASPPPLGVPTLRQLGREKARWDLISTQTAPGSGAGNIRTSSSTSLGTELPRRISRSVRRRLRQVFGRKLNTIPEFQGWTGPSEAGATLPKERAQRNLLFRALRKVKQRVVALKDDLKAKSARRRASKMLDTSYYDALISPVELTDNFDAQHNQLPWNAPGAGSQAKVNQTVPRDHRIPQKPPPPPKLPMGKGPIPKNPPPPPELPSPSAGRSERANGRAKDKGKAEASFPLLYTTSPPPQGPLPALPTSSSPPKFEGSSPAQAGTTADTDTNSTPPSGRRRSYLSTHLSAVRNPSPTPFHLLIPSASQKGLYTHESELAIRERLAAAGNLTTQELEVAVFKEVERQKEMAKELEAVGKEGEAAGYRLLQELGGDSGDRSARVGRFVGVNSGEIKGKGKARE